MIEYRQGGRRRLDRVLDPAFLAEVEQRPMDEVRGLRDEAAQEETDLSYLRRLLHARIDIVRFEQDRRAGAPATDGPGADGDAERALVDALPRILADNAIGPAVGQGRHQSVTPSRAESHRRHVEALVADTGLSDVATLPDAHLEAAVAEYAREEGAVSEHRTRGPEGDGRLQRRDRAPLPRGVGVGGRAVAPGVRGSVTRPDGHS